MTARLIQTEQRDIDKRIRANGLDPASFAYRVQASECITRYVRQPSRTLGTHVPTEALALYPNGQEKIYITFERDPRFGFRSTFRPSLNDEISASVLTWDELMGILDLWLKRLRTYTGLRGKNGNRDLDSENIAAGDLQVQNK